MKLTLQFSIAMLFFSIQTYAQSDKQKSSYYESTQKYIGNEFNLVLNDYNMDLIDRIINKNEAASDYDKQNFNLLMINLVNGHKTQTKQAERLLNSKLTSTQEVALRLARGLSRNEPGLNPQLLGFSGNYTLEQLQRKNRILELADFNTNEIDLINRALLSQDVLTNYTADNLIWDSTQFTADTAKRMNAEVIRQMHALSRNYQTTDEDRLHSLNEKQAIDLYETVTRHPVARLLNIKKYDPEGHLGFCFGRAMTTHLEALSRGIDKNSIRKVFVVGAMRALVGDIIWQFHVATAIKNSAGGWWVVDPFFGKVVSLETWYAKMYSHETKGNLRLYVTEANRLGAVGSAGYEKAHLSMGEYNNYFNDLLEYYRQKAHNEQPQKNVFTKMFDWTLSLFNIGI